MVLELRDYVDLTERDAESQWRAILRRTRLADGKRQEDFTPVETLMCFGLGLIANRTKSGTINIPASSADAQKIALLFKRTHKSIAAKLANLDGRRPHGAKHEQALWIRLTEDRFLFEHLYARIIDAGRRVGLESATLPDFLGVEDNRLQIVFDADKVTDSDLRGSIEGELAAVLDASPGLNISDTERALVGTARVGQRQFARKVLANAGYCCVFCGLSTTANGLPSSRLLVASHIKPWRQSEADQRVDALNGLAACPTHDAAFESHLFTVKGDGRVVRSHALERAIEQDAVMRHNFGPAGLANRLILPVDAALPRSGYIDWHASRTLTVEF